MFSSGNSNNDDDNPLESLFKRPSFQLSTSDLTQNPISKPLDHDPPFFSNFPSPFFDEHELPLNQILPRNLLMAAAADQTMSTHHNANNSHEYSTKEETTTTTKRRGSSKLKEKADGTTGVNAAGTRRKNLGGGAVPRKRTGKKDRHSKICTAQGIRDRRMRLSLQVARKFFDLQDMLGYDKASKTIEWLFNKSKKAIKDLTKEHPPGNNVNNIPVISDAKSESFLSECEVLSGIEETSNTEIKEGITQKNQIKTSRKIFNNKVPNYLKESREKARARARSRTREKMMIKHLGNCKSSPNNQDDVPKLGSSNSLFDQESGEKVSPYDTDDYNPSLMQEFGDEGTIEKLLLGNSSSGYNNHHCSATAAVSCCAETSTNFMGCLGNWEVMYNDRMNSGQFSVTNQQVSLAGEQPSTIYSSATTTTANFPLFQQ